MRSDTGHKSHQQQGKFKISIYVLASFQLIKFLAISIATGTQTYACNVTYRYGTAQLQGNVRMHLQDASETRADTRLGCEQDAYGMLTGHIPASAKPHGATSFFARHKMHLELMWGTSKMLAGRVQDACEHYYGAELYCNCDWACKNGACGLLKFDYFSNFWLL